MTTIGVTQTDQELLKAIRQIDAEVRAPGNGLPEELFLLVSRLTPLGNVDLLIHDDQWKILLTWRDDGIFSRGWHLPGGCVRIGESFGDRILAVAANELGTQINFAENPLAIHETVDKTRPSRTRYVSLLFDCKLKRRQEYLKASPQPRAWVWHVVCPDDLLQANYRSWFQEAGLPKKTILS